MNPTAQEIGIWLLVFGQFVTIGSAVVVIVASFRTQKREVSLRSDFATLPELQKIEHQLEARVTKAEGEFGQRFAKVEGEFGQRVGNVDHDIRKLRQEIVSNGEVRRQSIESKVEGVRSQMQGEIKNVERTVLECAKEIATVGAQCEMINASLVRLTSDVTNFFQREVT